MTSLTADGQGGSPSAIALDDARDRGIGPGDIGRVMISDADHTKPSRVADRPTPTGTVAGRVPHHAFVVVGCPHAPTPTVLPTANDNTRAGATRTRSVWRDLFFLAILAMTIVGAFWSGKLNATQRVIVVPGPSSDRHVVT